MPGKTLGERQEGRRATFQLLGISIPGTGTIFGADDQCLLSVAPRQLVLEEPSIEELSEISITLTTPLRLKDHEHLQAELPSMS